MKLVLYLVGTQLYLVSYKIFSDLPFISMDFDSAQSIRIFLEQLVESQDSDYKLHVIIWRELQFSMRTSMLPKSSLPNL